MRLNLKIMKKQLKDFVCLNLEKYYKKLYKNTIDVENLLEFFLVEDLNSTKSFFQGHLELEC
jgi:hypothetical protein